MKKFVRVASVEPDGSVEMMSTAEYVRVEHERLAELSTVIDPRQRVCGNIALGKLAEQVGLPLTALNRYRAAMRIGMDDDWELARFRFVSEVEYAARRVDAIMSEIAGVTIHDAHDEVKVNYDEVRIKRIYPYDF